MNFKDIIGNESVKKNLQDIIESDKIGHSYMFIGIDGIGKKLIAKEFAKKILCISKTKGCNICKSCTEFEGDNHPDCATILPDGKNIKIDQIRECQKKVYEKPVISEKKVYIIDDADKMTKEAQNCLLKTLEEPPQYIVIILIAADEDKLLNTIKSRCTKVTFSKLKREELKKYLGDENVQEDLLKRANGSIKKLIHIQENINSYMEITNVINNIENKSLVDVLKNTEIFTKNKDIIYEILEYISLIYYEKIYNFDNKQSNYIKCIQTIEEVKRRIASNSNFDMSVDYFLLKIWEEMNE